MSDDEKDDGPAIYRVETVPPPDGEDDAYSAPTKVGPMADAAVRELMQAAEKRAQELSARLAEKKAASVAAAKAASSMPTPMSLKPTGVISSKRETPAAPSLPTPAAPTPPATPPSPSGSLPAAASTGPVSGRVTMPGSAPVGRTVSSTPPRAARAPSVPRPAAIPRVDAVSEQVAPPVPRLAPPPVALSLEGDPAFPQPPRVYDENDETDDAETLLHKSARPPRQEHTELLPTAGSGRPSGAPMPTSISESPRSRDPIPFDRALAAPAPEETTPRVLLMPLVVGFLIFALGLGFYIWAR